MTRQVLLSNQVWQYLDKPTLSCCLDFVLSFVKLCDPSEWWTMLTWSRSHTLHPYMLYSYNESKQQHAFPPFHKMKTPCIQDLSPFSIQLWKRDMGYMLYKKGGERVEKRELEKMSEKNVEQKKRGWASKIAHDLNHLDLERASLRSQPSTHIHTLALLIMFVCCFSPWIHAFTLQYKHSKYAFQVILPKTPYKL